MWLKPSHGHIQRAGEKDFPLLVDFYSGHEGVSISPGYFEGFLETIRDDGAIMPARL